MRNISSKITSRTEHSSSRRNWRRRYFKHTWFFKGDRCTHDQTVNGKSWGRQPRTDYINVILGSNAPPILGTQYTSPKTKSYTTLAVTNKEYIENIHATHGHIQIKQLTKMLTEEGKCQPSFKNNLEDAIENCTTSLPKRVRSTKATVHFLRPWISMTLFQ